MYVAAANSVASTAPLASVSYAVTNEAIALPAVNTLASSSADTSVTPFHVVFRYSSYEVPISEAPIEVYCALSPV